MTFKIEEASPIQRRVRFELDGSAVSSELDRAYSNLGKKARLPGFRQGKIPRNVLEARFGKAIQGEVMEKLISQSWREAMEGLEVAGRPAVEEQSELQRGKPFSFTIAVEVKPELAVKDYTGLEVKYPVGEVTEQQLDNAVKRRLQSQVKIEEVTEERPVGETDFVLTELVLTAPGEGGAELAREPGTMVNMQGERYYPGVETLLLGMKKDEEKTGTVLLGDSAIPALQGIEANAYVKVVGIQAQIVPELSDEIAKELGFEGGAEGMRMGVKAKLQEGVDETSKNQARANLLRILVDMNEFEVPTAMVDEQYQALMEELRIRRAYSGQDPRTMRLSDAEAADLRERALFAAKASCILVAVSKQEGIQVDDADISKKIHEIAEIRGQADEAIRAYLERDEAMGMLETRILEEKTLEWLMERSKLVEEKPGEKSDTVAAKPKKAKKKKGEDTAEAGAADAAAEEAPAEEAAPADQAAEAKPKKAKKKKSDE